MRVRVMTNPAELLLAGNPGKKPNRMRFHSADAIASYNRARDREVEARLNTLEGEAERQKRNAETLARMRAKSNPSKERPMAKRRKKKSKASREKRIAKRRARRASRKGKMPAGLKAYWAGKKRGKTRRRRSAKARRSRMKRKSTKRSYRRRRSRARRHVKNVVASSGTKVVVRKVRRGKVRSARKRSGRRVGSVGVNASSLSLVGGLTHVVDNLKATMKDGVKGFAFAFGGAAASVVGGSFVSNITGNLVAKVAPQMLTNPVVSRLLGAVNYYLPGWAAARFIPGLSGKSRRAMLTGAAVAALVEVVKPGMVRQTLARVPVVGSYLSDAEDSAGDLGAYVGFALNGMSEERGYPAVYDGDGNAIIDQGVSDYLALSDYASTDGQDAAVNIGVGEYENVLR